MRRLKVKPWMLRLTPTGLVLCVLMSTACDDSDYAAVVDIIVAAADLVFGILALT